MARGYMRWSVRDLAEASGVSSATIKRMEEKDGTPMSLADNLQKIQRVLEGAGVEFTNGDAPGVRLRSNSRCELPPLIGEGDA
jgi:transcriptional regulator with XRE-family HTH domain